MANENNQMFQGVSRNSECPCGSGKRFKHCHGNSNQQNVVPAPISEEKVSANSNLSDSNHLFCTVEGKFYEMGDHNQYFFVADHSESRVQLDQRACLVLQEMEIFATFKEHFAKCFDKYGIEEKQFRNTIDHLDQQGFFKTAESVIKMLAESKLSEPIGDVCGICIRTCDTPGYLMRILESQTRRKEKFGANEKVYIFDDSRSDVSISENIGIVKEASKSIDVSYFGLEKQSAFADDLISNFPLEAEIIRKLLLPQEGVSFSGGRIMNLALLFFAGKKYLNFDDDFILDDVRVHDLNDSNIIQLDIVPDKVYDGYANEAQVMQAGVSIDIDPLLWHKRSLGLTLSDFLLEQGDDYQITEETLKGVNVYGLKRYLPESTIITTGNGWFGTSGKRDGRFIFLAEYKKLKPPWVTANNFEQLLKGGYCWDAIAQTEITTQGFSTPAGINNTQLLPPTIATCKSEDNLLCSMTKLVHPNSVHLGFSWALAHFREPKNWDDDTFNSSKPFQLPDLIKDISENILMPELASCSDRMESISVALMEASLLSKDVFIERLETCHLNTFMWQSKYLYKQIESLTQEEGGCRSQILRIIENDLKHVTSSQLPPIEDALGDNKKEQLQWAQQELRAYARGLSIWSKLWQFCASKTT